MNIDEQVTQLVNKLEEEGFNVVEQNVNRRRVNITLKGESIELEDLKSYITSVFDSDNIFGEINTSYNVDHNDDVSMKFSFVLRQ